MTNANSVNIREAWVEEIEALVALRIALFEAMDFKASEIEAAIPSMHAYFAEHLPTGAFRVWVAEVEGRLVSSIGLVIHSVPPSPHNLTVQEAYVMNLVTLPAYRRQGLAKALLRHVLEAARTEGISVVTLHASNDGRSLYEALGFSTRRDVPEMVLQLSPTQQDTDAS